MSNDTRYTWIRCPDCGQEIQRMNWWGSHHAFFHADPNSASPLPLHLAGVKNIPPFPHEPKEAQ